MTAAPARPGWVSFAVGVMFVGGIAQIALGILTIFLRYAQSVVDDGIAFPITLVGTGMILLGLFVIALASGVARASRASRLSATTVLLLGLALMLIELWVSADGDWSGVLVQGAAAAAVIIPLWSRAGRRYFAVRRPAVR